MRITLIYPAIFTHAKFGSFGSDNYVANFIHHGLCSLSAACKKSGFNNIDLIDLRACKNWSDLYDFCVKNNLLLVKNTRSYNKGMWDKKLRGVDYAYIKKLKNDYYGFSHFRRFLEKPLVLTFLSLPGVDRYRKYLFRLRLIKIIKKLLIYSADIIDRLFRYAKRKLLHLMKYRRKNISKELNLS